MQGNPGQSWILNSTRWILDFRYWMPVFFFGTWIPDSNRYGPINVKPAGGAGGGGWGGGQGMGWRFDIFQKIAVKFPAHGQIILVNCNQLSPPRGDIAVHPKAGPKKGTIEISPNKTSVAIFIYKRCCITKDTCSYYSCD